MNSSTPSMAMAGKVSTPSSTAYSICSSTFNSHHSTSGMHWLAAALRAPIEHSKVTYCMPSVNVVPYDSASREDNVACDIFCTFDNAAPANPEEAITGHCWYDMFSNSTVALGFPVPQSGPVGLEVSLPVTAALVGATQITKFGTKLFLKGFSSLLFLRTSVFGTARQEVLS